jgi:hypothetical protein
MKTAVTCLLLLCHFNLEACMTNGSETEFLVGAWCTFPVKGDCADAVKIAEIEEIGMRFGIPYIRFRAAVNPGRVIEILGQWSIRNDSMGI